jgi:hypothetical protein
MADVETLPAEVQPPPSRRKYWTRKGIAQWLVEQLQKNHVTIVGIDHGFSFPLRYFEVNHLLPDWPAFLDDFQRHWSTEQGCICLGNIPILYIQRHIKICLYRIWFFLIIKI